jgi:Skp family chaperone for outer membrane proteins
MKKKNIVILGVLVGIIAVGMGYDQGWARARREIMPAKVGVVNIEAIFESSEKHEQWRRKMDANQIRKLAELKKLDQQAEAIKADMETRKAGSPDYMSRMSAYLEKKATTDAMSKFYEAEFAVQGQKWMDDLYGQIETVIREIAREKGLDIVLADEEIDLAKVANVQDIATLIRSNKILYHSVDIDITQEVLAELDASM